MEEVVSEALAAVEKEREETTKRDEVTPDQLADCFHELATDDTKATDIEAKIASKATGASDRLGSHGSVSKATAQACSASRRSWCAQCDATSKNVPLSNDRNVCAKTTNEDAAAQKGRRSDQGSTVTI